MISERLRLYAQVPMLIDYAVDDYTDTEVDTMKKRLLGLPSRWRELLVRYYCDGQSSEEICARMGFSAAEFREIKREARVRLTGIR